MPRSCDPFRQNNKRLIAETLLNDYGDLSENNLFLGIGKITPWGTTDIRVESIDSVKDDTDFWRGMIAAKRINRSDVSLVVPRVDWSAGVVYTPYRDTNDMFDDVNPANFYALVDEERVYVCIDNNYGSASLNAPNHTDSVIRKLADGYRWKFLYQIPESKRKFLTKTNAGALGYMPIEYVESLRFNDDRKLQWYVQEAAIPGKIDFAYVDEIAKNYWVSTNECILPGDNPSANIVTQTVPVGATGVRIYAPNLSTEVNAYKNMMFTVEGGAGKGQRRKISEYSYAGSYGQIAIDALSIGLSGSDPGVGDKQSLFSITPVIDVVGDGTSNDTTYNPTNRTADFKFKFGPTAASSSQCSGLLPRYIDSVEVVDGGKDYTFAKLSVAKGLNYITSTPAEYRDFSSLIHAVMPPTGGHGSNAVRELGAAAIMIVKDFSQDENGKVDVGNDYRQIGIIRNPLLQEKQVRIKFYQPGLSGSFAVGATVGQQTTSVYGTVLEWCNGSTGYTATSELVLGDIRGGTFAAGGTVSGLTIFDVAVKTVAGTEGRHLLDLTLASQNGQFASSGNDYRRNFFAYGVGNQATNVSQSRSSGQIYCWSLNPATNSYGTLSLENSKGDFTLGETVLQRDPYFFGSNSVSGPGKITAMETRLVDVPTVYDLTTTMVITGQNMSSSTFPIDSQVFFVSGMTGGNGYVIDWEISGTTAGTLRITGVQGSVLTGQSVSYYVASDGSTASPAYVSRISTISHRGELKYRSGEILYIQNVNPILRDLEQREEIKLVIEM